MKDFVSYDSFLSMVKDPQKMDGLKNFSEQYQSALQEGRTMSLEEADKILEELNLPDELREWIEYESLGEWKFERKVNEHGARLVDLLPEFDSSLNEDAEWTSMNEEEMEKFESSLWEGIYSYIITENINEGFWGSLLQGVKVGAKKAIATGKALITGVGKVIKGVIEAAKKGIKTIGKMAAGQAKSIAGAIQGQAESRFERMHEHSDEQVEKDSEDLGSTVEWFSGKSLDVGVEQGTQAAAKVGGAALQSDEEGKKAAAERLIKTEKASKKAPKKAPKRESVSKHAYGAVKVLQECNKEELYELAIAAFVLEIKESQSLNETDIESHFLTLNISEGLRDSIKKMFGGSKDKKEEMPKDVPGPKDKEDELVKKDQERAKKIKAPSAPEKPSMEDKAAKAKESVSKGDSKIGEVIGKVVRLVVQGPVLIVEWVAEFGLKRGLRAFSACTKKFGGPGVFLFIAIAAAGAILIGLAVEAVATMTHGDFAKVFHFSALGSGIHFLVHALEHAASSAAHACVPILKWVPVALSVYFAFLHLKHIFHDKKLGKNVDHDKAAQMEDKAIEKDTAAKEGLGDDENSKKIAELLDEKIKLREDVKKFHVEQKGKKDKVIELDKSLKGLKNKVKKAGGKDLKKMMDQVHDIKNNIKVAKKELAELKGEKPEKDGQGSH